MARLFKLEGAPVRGCVAACLRTKATCWPERVAGNLGCSWGCANVRKPRSHLPPLAIVPPHVMNWGRLCIPPSVEVVLSVAAVGPLCVVLQVQVRACLCFGPCEFWSIGVRSNPGATAFNLLR